MTQRDPHPTEAFRAARDFYLEHHGDPQTQRAECAFPNVGGVFNWAHDWFDVIAADNHRVALKIAEENGADHQYTFAELKDRSDQLGGWLLEQGVAKGDVMMLMLDNQVELWELMLAALKIGAVILPTSVVLNAHELTDRVTRGQVRWVCAGPANAAKFADVPGNFTGIAVWGSGARRGSLDDEIPQGWMNYAASYEAPIRPLEKVTTSDDPALIYFTSGTTNLPKIVVHTQVSYPVGHLSTMAWIGVKPGDTHLVISAPGWGKHAWSSFFGPWHAEATIFVFNYARFDAEQLVHHLDEAGVNTFCAPPTVWRMLIQKKLSKRPRALREVVSAGEPLNAEVIARIQEWWGLEIRDGYGQTETTALIGNLPGDPIVPGAMGAPLPGINIVLVDEHTGEIIPEGSDHEGEVCLPLDPHPLNLTPGYFANPTATERSRVGGVYHTGDVAVRDKNGVLTFVGRTDDIFKSSDFKVSPFEVESALVEHPAVAEAAVVGAPDPTRLNITKAYVTLNPGWEETAETAREILAHARVALPAYMRARRLEFWDLPKTISGKIRRVELRKREEEFYERGEKITTEWRESDFPGLKKRRW